MVSQQWVSRRKVIILENGKGHAGHRKFGELLLQMALRCCGLATKCFDILLFGLVCLHDSRIDESGQSEGLTVLRLS